MMEMTRNLVTRLLAAPGMTSQRQVAARAARVIDKVIFDIGVDRLLQGTIELDWRLRPCFHGCTRAAPRAPLALVSLGGLSEAAALGAAFHADAPVLHPYTAAVVAALLREFRAQSPRFCSLP